MNEGGSNGSNSNSTRYQYSDKNIPALYASITPKPTNLHATEKTNERTNDRPLVLLQSELPSVHRLTDRLTSCYTSTTTHARPAPVRPLSHSGQPSCRWSVGKLAYLARSVVLEQHSRLVRGCHAMRCDAMHFALLLLLLLHLHRSCARCQKVVSLGPVLWLSHTATGKLRTPVCEVAVPFSALTARRAWYGAATLMSMFAHSLHCREFTLFVD